MTVDASKATDVTITGDADGDDVTVAGTFITDVAASFGQRVGDANDLLDDNSRVLNFTNDTGDLTLSGLTLSGGRTTGDNQGLPFVPRDNAYSGGGIRFLSEGSVLLNNSNVTGNSTTGFGSDGGGIYTSSGTVVLLDSELNGNSTSEFDASGGGIATNTGNVSLTNSTLSQNRANASNGGGIYTRAGDVSLITSTLSENNSSLGDGGGINSGSGNVSLVNSTVSGNSASASFSVGGGIKAGSGSISLTNSTISENRSTGDGGGIYATEGDVSVTNSTIFGNVAERGDGGGLSVPNVFNRSIVTIKNSIVAGNSDAGGSPDFRSTFSNTLVVNYSLIGDTGGTNINSNTGTGNILNRPALLAALADNGGPTLTHALLPDSAAINAGSDALAVDADGVPLTNDQRGGVFDRVRVGAVDIGSFESNFDAAIPPTVVSATINEGGVLARPDLFTSLTVVFDRDVDLSADALTLFNDAPRGSSVDLSGVDFSYDPATNTAIWNFSNVDPLDAAFYTYRLDANSIASGNVTLDGNGDETRGDDFVDQHYVAIPGDVNLDGTLDVVNDAFTLISNLVTPSGALFADGDLNGDGRVDILGDAFILVANLNRNVDLVSDVVVSNNTDLVNGDTSSVFALIRSDGGDGISLREAVIASNNTIGSGAISFDDGVFTGGTDSLIRLTQDELDITDSLTIDASAATDVVVTGDAEGDDILVAGSFITDVDASFSGIAGDATDLLDDNSRVLDFSSATGDLTLSGLALTGGRTTGFSRFSASDINQTTAQNGGAIRFLSAGQLIIENSTASGNSTTGDGGAISAFSGNVSIVNSTISDNSTYGYYARGGAVSNDSGNISLTNSVLSGNRTLTGGGGIFANSGDVSLIGSTLNANSTGYGPGGGIYALYGDVSLNDSVLKDNSANENSGGGIAAFYGDVSVISSRIYGNVTSGGASGGGIATRYGDVSLVDSNVFENRTAGAGGGIYVEDGNVALINSEISQNDAQAAGGGIFIGDGSFMSTNSMINQNQTRGDSSGGGGVSVSGGGGDHVLLTNSAIIGNSTLGNLSPGGGIRVSTFDAVTVINSTVSGNSTSGPQLSPGGGIAAESGTFSLINSTVTQNSAVNNSAGGIFALSSSNPSTVIVENSIVAGNTDNGVAPDFQNFTNSSIAINHSLIGDTTGSSITPATGTGNILDQPALLGPLADNGGPTLTHALLPGSPAIDAGDDTLAADEDGVSLANDQRGEGFDRVFGSSVDIGAFELQPVAVPAQFVLAGDDVVRDDVFGSDF